MTCRFDAIHNGRCLDCGRPALYDVYCGAGGCSVGYWLAGYCPRGVDINPQKNYPFAFIQMDALKFLRQLMLGLWPRSSLIHTSPPCQAYSISRNNGCHKEAPKMIENTRSLLRAIGIPYVIENVFGAPLENAIQICGASFGLGVSGFDLNRHRYFETSLAMLSMPCQHKKGRTIGVYGNGTNSWHRKKFGRCITVDEMRQAMGIDWMTRSELSQAIPPAYTEYIGKQILKVIQP